MNEKEILQELIEFYANLSELCLELSYEEIDTDSMKIFSKRFFKKYKELAKKGKEKDEKDN